MICFLNKEKNRPEKNYVIKTQDKMVGIVLEECGWKGKKSI